MTSTKRPRRLSVGVEAALAYVASAAVFGLVGVTVAAIDADVPVVLLGLAILAGVVVVAPYAGVAFAVPIAMASLLAYDWYYVPPKHPEAFPDFENLLTLLVFLAVAVVVGEVGGRAKRRADLSERARDVLADEQAALRRVATLVARGVEPSEVFDAVARELGQLLGVSSTHIGRFESPDNAVGVGSWSADGSHVSVGTRAALDGTSVSGLVWRTGRPARIDDYAEASGPIASISQELGIRSSAGAPILVDGGLWGVMVVSSKSARELPPDTEARITAFSELTATAISNTEARAQLRQLAEEQAALRRVATLVAENAPPEELFHAVAEEVRRVVDADAAGILRYEVDDSMTVMATPDRKLPAGTSLPLEGRSLSALILKTHETARIDDWGGLRGPIAEAARDRLGLGSSVGAPIVVEGRLWGVLTVYSTRAERLPDVTEARVSGFAELVATAIANAQARGEVARLAEEQAALRRVATLVAQEASPGEVFAAVAEEVGRVLEVEDSRMVRYEADATVSVVASWGELANELPVGMRIRAEAESVSSTVLRTGRAARMDAYHPASGPVGNRIQALGVRSAVGTPIVVEGRLWGAMIAASLTPEPLPADTELRIAEFTALLGTAIANIEARANLAASRARIVAATDETRRRFERDLHDGAQQRLVSLGLELRCIEALAPEGLDDLRAQLAQVGEGLDGVLDDLRELSRGIHPAILSEGGIRPALRALARRSAVPIDLGVTIDGRLDDRVEAAAYFVVSEALTNTAKHAGASLAKVRVEARGDLLNVTVRDDGCGGADPSRGSGLVGLRDRVEALDGRISILSPTGGGTSLQAELPLDLPASRYAETTADPSRR